LSAVRRSDPPSWNRKDKRRELKLWKLFPTSLERGNLGNHTYFVVGVTLRGEKWLDNIPMEVLRVEFILIEILEQSLGDFLGEVDSRDDCFIGGGEGTGRRTV